MNQQIPFNLGAFEILIYTEILSWKNGSDLVLKYLHSENEEDCLVTHTVRLITICLYNNIAFDMPASLRPRILTAIADIIDKVEVYSLLKKTFEASEPIPAPSSFHTAVAETISSDDFFDLLDGFGLPPVFFDI